MITAVCIQGTIAHFTPHMLMQLVVHAFPHLRTSLWLTQIILHHVDDLLHSPFVFNCTRYCSFIIVALPYIIYHLRGDIIFIFEHISCNGTVLQSVGNTRTFLQLTLDPFIGVCTITTPTSPSQQHHTSLTITTSSFAQHSTFHLSPVLLHIHSMQCY